MVDAISSVVTNAPFVRSNVEQASSARAPQAPQETLEAPSVPVAPFVSPFIQVDTNFNEAVIQVRNADTGDVVRQFPSESTLRARQQAESLTSSQAERQRSQEDVEVNTTPIESGDASQNVAAQAAEAAVPAPNPVNAQAASNALSAAAQTSEIAQATVNTSA